MVTKELRKLSHDERKALYRMLNSARPLEAIVFSFIWPLVIMVLPLMLLSKYFKVLEDDQYEIPILIIVISISVIIGIRNIRKLNIQSQREDIKRDLDRGEAEVTTFEVTDAIKVEEYEDLGIGYFLKIADDKVLFLQGQYLYEDEDEDEDGQLFPCTKFQIIRTPITHELLALKCEGDCLIPSSTRAAFTINDYRRGLVPKDGEILNVNFDTLR